MTRTTRLLAVVALAGGLAAPAALSVAPATHHVSSCESCGNVKPAVNSLVDRTTEPVQPLVGVPPHL